MLLIYTFLPVKSIFNYKGRKWLALTFLEACACIFTNIQFKHTFLMDQITSLVGPMRDIEYSVCYYVYYKVPFEERMQLCSMNRGIVLFIGIFPHFIRALQCLKLVYKGKAHEKYNAGKYAMAISVAVFSFIGANIKAFDAVWLVFAIVSSFYSTFWDIIYDFGFFEKGKNYPLRNKLSYNNKFFYYFVMFSDLFLRFIWLISLSPEIVYSFARPEFFSFIISA
jgi:hypothetical protein